MVKLLSRAETVYRYIKNKKSKVFTLMDVKPQQGLVERDCVGLGAKIYNPGSKKDCYIDVKEYKD
jgi:hypothetical protein